MSVGWSGFKLSGREEQGAERGAHIAGIGGGCRDCSAERPGPVASGCDAIWRQSDDS